MNDIKVTEGHVKVPWTRRLVRTVGFLERVGGNETAEAITDAGDWLEQTFSVVEHRVASADPAGRQNLHNFVEGAKRVAQGQSPGERGYPQGEKTYDDAAMRLFRSGVRYVVMGHTHHPLVRKCGGRVYVNSGSWVWDRYPPTYARYANGRLELFEANTHRPYVPPEPSK
jgi:hypothetical protein